MSSKQIKVLSWLETREESLEFMSVFVVLCASQQQTQTCCSPVVYA